jgi:hypothetical protein
MVTLIIKDETMTGNVQGTFDIQFDTEFVTIKDIIEARVHAEVAKYNSTLKEYFNGLVQPTEAEHTLNGYKMKERKTIDAEKQVYIALDAFQRNGFFVLVNDRQAESLDEELFLSGNDSVSFVRLTPLVGG